ncbi:hypothetical protein QBC35DRAFT_532554 [Podospora australis]|uniref:Mid2 domain-containing protein n=1 Tax=Podospora australis TaxID=1536484 RepID=A0AAN7AI36_9PEZI|nr:hypothetical protein QBC35DRAFT_532554 [Podospora australis]
MSEFTPFLGVSISETRDAVNKTTNEAITSNILDITGGSGCGWGWRRVPHIEGNGSARQNDDDDDDRTSTRGRITTTTRITPRPSTTLRSSTRTSTSTSRRISSTPSPSPSRTASETSSTESTTTTESATETTGTATESQTSSSGTESPTPTESTPTEQQPATGRGGNSISAGTAAGIAAGAVGGLAILGLVLFLLWRKRQGGIRGAVVTADYPDTMGMVDNNNNNNNQPPPSGPSTDRSLSLPREDSYFASDGVSPAAMPMMNNSRSSFFPDQQYPALASPGRWENSQQRSMSMSQYYQANNNNKTLTLPSPAAAAFGQVSPMSTNTFYRHSSLPQVSPYYPGAERGEAPPPRLQGGERDSALSSPSLPQFMIPGGAANGTRSRTMSYTSVSQYSSATGDMGLGTLTADDPLHQPPPVPPLPLIGTNNTITRPGPGTGDLADPPLSPLRRNPS